MEKMPEVSAAEKLAEMTQQSMFVLMHVKLERHHRNVTRKVHADLLTQVCDVYIHAGCELLDTADELPHIQTKGLYYANEGFARNLLKNWRRDLTPEMVEQRFDLGDPTSAVRVIVADDVGTILESLRVEDAGYRAFSDLDVFYGALAICTTRRLSENGAATFFRRLNGLRTCFRKKMERLQEAVKALQM